jgi:hypothetical protein
MAAGDQALLLVARRDDVETCAGDIGEIHSGFASPRKKHGTGSDTARR